jgi:hypothetical protein
MEKVHAMMKDVRYLHLLMLDVVLLFLNLMTKQMIRLLMFVVVQMDFVFVVLKIYLDFEYLSLTMMNHILTTILLEQMVSTGHLVLISH